MDRARRAWADRRWHAALAVLATLAPVGASACPFCGAVGPTLAMRRDAAAVTAVGTAAGPVAVTPADGPMQPFTLLQALRGPPVAREEPVRARVAAEIAGTAILFGVDDASLAPPERRRWQGVAADEGLIAHVMAAPAVSRPPAARLPYFAARLEHPDMAIADDAFAEFGQAPFAAVVAAAPDLAARPLADWLADPATDQRKRGFYGLALGIVIRAGLADGAGGRPSAAALRDAIAGGGDFRAGIDGLMGGLLVADGTAGLEWLLDRSDPARPVEQKQLLAALRFAAEERPAEIPVPRVIDAVARLATSPVTASEAVVDLARLGGWDHVDTVAGLWDSVGADDPHVRRAVAGFLVACPGERAHDRLERLRRADPRRLEQAIAAARALRPE